MKDITVGIKSFLRPNKIDRCLESLRGRGFSKVVVADDGKIDNNKQHIYEKHRRHLNLELLRLEKDSGLAYGRNKAFEHCNTKYFLLLDDDQVVRGRIRVLKKILENDESLGGISPYLCEIGDVRCSATNLFLFDNYIVKHANGPLSTETIDGYTYYKFEQIPNGTLFKSEVLNDAKWDPFYKIGKEHIDFYLNHKINTKWSFAVTPYAMFDHYPSSSKNNYGKRYRGKEARLKRSENYFKKKWNISRIYRGRYFREKRGCKSIKSYLYGKYSEYGIHRSAYVSTSLLSLLYKKIRGS